MPLGRDSIKRVKNNGYSRVTTSAPDMENSSIVEPIDLSVVVVEVPNVEAEQKAAEPAQKKKTAPKKKAEPKKTADKDEPAKKKPLQKKKSEPKPAAKTKRKTKKPTPVSNNDIPTPTEVAETVTTRCGEGYINLGGELPIYLL